MTEDRGCGSAPQRTIPAMLEIDGVGPTAAASGIVNACRVTSYGWLEMAEQQRASEQHDGRGEEL